MSLMDSFEWTKHKKFISEKNSNFQKTLNFTTPTILPQKTLRWTLLAPGRGLFKYEKKRFFCQVARKRSLIKQSQSATTSSCWLNLILFGGNSI